MDDKYLNEEIEEIIRNFEGRIQRNLYNTIYAEREDLAQEIRLKLVEKLRNLTLDEPPSFWSYIEKVKV